MKARLARYLERQYEQFDDIAIDDMIAAAIVRLAAKDYLSQEALDTAIETMKEEGWPSRKILSHLNIIDIEDRT